MFWSALKSISQASDGLLDSSAKKLFLCITVGVFRNPKVSAIKKIKLQYNLQWQFFFWTVISFANSLDYTLCLLWLETNKFTWPSVLNIFWKNIFLVYYHQWKLHREIKETPCADDFHQFLRCLNFFPAKMPCRREKKQGVYIFVHAKVVIRVKKT